MTVHISGYGLVSPLGLTADETFDALRRGDSAARFMPEWSQVEGLHSHVASLVPEYDVSSIPRKLRRTMSRMSEMGCLAADECLATANLAREELSRRRTMIIAGSTTGSPIAMRQSLKHFHQTGSFTGEVSTTVFKCMSHSLSLNLAAYLDFNGPVLSPSAACSTGAQAILLGKQMIDSGYCDLVIAGGADECDVTSCFSFDVALAASRGFNHTPEQASRPFDRDRDGIVVSEGAALIVLESEQSLNSRGATSHGVVLGGAQRCDGQHVSRPIVPAMAETMREALADACVVPCDIGYVNAHATSTRLGDQSEALAIHEVIGEGKPVSSLKGHLGHSFAAAGSTEAILSLMMLQQGVMLGTKNLNCPDPEMPPLYFVTDDAPLPVGPILSNSFAFGGFNVSLVLSRASG